MSRWTMSRKLAAGFLAVLLMSMSVGAFLLNRMGHMDGETERVLETSDRIKVALDAHEALILLGRAALISVITANPEAGVDSTLAQRGQTESEGAVKRMVDGVAKLRSSASGDPAELKLLDELSANASELQGVLDEATNSRATLGGLAATQVLVAKGAPVSDKGQALLDKMVKIVESAQAKAAKKSADAYERSRNLALLLSGLATLLAASIAWRVSRSVSRSVGRGAASVSTSSADLGVVSAQLSANAMETAMQADVVSGAAGRVSDSVQTVASAVEEMTASVREIAQNAGEASRVAEQAVEVAEATNATVSKLGVSSAEIGEVIAVITSIAEQTNLLALNATIEAARAGEAGKGFAVVANEVKELAKETAKATDDISGKIAAIQSDTGGAVEAIRRIGSIIAQISGIQNTIAAAVEEQTATTNEIARNVSDAARGSAEIAENIGSVADTARTTSDGATAIEDAAAGLADVADELQSLVGIIHGRHPSPVIAAFDAGRQGRSVMVRESEHVG